MIRIPKSVIQKIERKAQKTRKRDFQKVFKKRFEETKREMIQEFMSHPVTIELLAGSSSSNISGTLGGQSNLFAFIGFNASDKPIEPILKVLESTSFKDTGESNSGRRFTLLIPTSDEIFAVSPMPWAAGRSWAKGIEKGISGLGYLLNKSTSSSRSGVAIQADKKVRTARFNNVQYISALLNKYKKKFKEMS
jgi:hypothetical protein